MSPARLRSRRSGKFAEEASSQPRAEPSLPPADHGSWRMVEGEHDSFDTSILSSSAGDEADDVLVPRSSGQPPSSGPPSQQPPSQGNASASQDSIRDFVKHQDDEQVILREPFRPSVASSTSSAGQQQQQQQKGYRTPDPQFRMPLMGVVEGSRRSSGGSRTFINQYSLSASFEGEDEGHSRRRRGRVSTGSPAQKKSPRTKKSSLKDAAAAASADADATGDGDDNDNKNGEGEGEEEEEEEEEDDHRRGGTRRRAAATAGVIAALLPPASLRMLVWAGDVISIALRFARYPLGLLLATYMVLGGAIVVQNMATRSFYSAVSPICRLPGTSLLNLPFCAAGAGVEFGDGGGPGGGGGQVEFDDLMGVQSKFEQVLERSAEGVSLPLEMKRSELAVRDLRSLVRHSDLQARHELVLEFDGYIETAGLAASDLQRFNVHVGSAVDAVISINRWTSRFIDSLSSSSSSSSPSPAGSAADAAGLPSPLADWARWLFGPFQPADLNGPDERVILDKYVEHTGLVSQRIASLILEAQAVLRLLTRAEDHLGLIYDITARTSASVSSRRDEILWNVWSLVGANAGRLQSLAQQLSLLRQVDAQRSTAAAQLAALVLELESIQANLGDLRERVSEPQLRGAASARIPLSVHIETIDRGVERLQAARRRIRAAEDDRVRDTVAGLQQGEDKQLIDAGRGK